MNIRIGNDIKVNFTIREPEGTNTLNIKQLKCYFINDSFKSKYDLCDIIKRFPKEPFPLFYTPSEYTLNDCGLPRYNQEPCYDKCSYSTYCDMHDPHYWNGYNGFGINSKKFIDFKELCFKYDFPKYLAYYELNELSNSVSAYFPAKDLIMQGPYRFSVVLELYQEGWGSQNIHTYTIDYGLIFNLVCDENGKTGDITINLDEKVIDTTVVKINTISDTIYINEQSYLEIGQYDSYNNQYDIELYLSDGNKIKYNPSNSKYIIKFLSDDDRVTVDENGKITVGKINEDIIAVITIKYNENIFSEFTVHVKNNKKSYIGFTNTTDVNQLDLDAVDSENRKLFNEVDNISGNHTVLNFNDGYYLWVISEYEIENITSGSFSIPISNVQMSGDYYCYYCLNALIATDFNINIKLK